MKHGIKSAVRILALIILVTPSAYAQSIGSPKSQQSPADFLASLEQQTKNLTQQIESGPSSGDHKEMKLLLLLRASNYSILRNYPGVIEDIETVFSMGVDLNDIQLFGAHFLRGSAYASLGKYDKALTDLVQSKILQPDNAEVHALQGTVFAHQRNFDDAIMSFKTALSLNPNDTDTSILLGAVYIADSQLENALQIFNSMIESELDAMSGYLGRMKVMEAMGHDDDAARDLEKAIELGYEPEN